jgi:hypothetical protein
MVRSQPGRGDPTKAEIQKMFEFTIQATAQVADRQRTRFRTAFLSLIPAWVSKWLPGLGSNLRAALITNDLSLVNGCFNADCLTNSMRGTIEMDFLV